MSAASAQAQTGATGSDSVAGSGADETRHERAARRSGPEGGTARAGSRLGRDAHWLAVPKEAPKAKGTAAKKPAAGKKAAPPEPEPEPEPPPPPPDKETKKAAAEEAKPAPDSTPAPKNEGKKPGEDLEDKPDAERRSLSEEKPGTTYYYAGLRFRLAIIPQFMFKMFSADGGRAVISPAIGPELGVRRNGFEYDVWLTFASYSMDDVPFKSSSDPDYAWEIVRAELKTLSVGSDFLWSTPLREDLSVVYGGGAGIGIVFGGLYRNQSFPANGVPGDPSTYLKCPAPRFNNSPWCGNDNDHYGGYQEPSWVNGGSKPLVFPWIALPQLGLRWKPHPKAVLRFDTGLSLPGPFFFGFAGQYGAF
jgi:hypothetical protein